MVGGFFSILIGYLIFLLMSYHEASKIGNRNRSEQNYRKQYAIDYHKTVWLKCMRGDERIYVETRSGKEVYKDIDKHGLSRWYYTNTKRPMQYAEDKRLLTSLNHNKNIALKENRKWCVVEDFWDDSIIRLENRKELNNTYLDDFTDRGNPFEVLKWNEFVRKWNKENPDKHQKMIIRNSRCLFNYANSTPEQKEKYKVYFYNNNPLNQKVFLPNMRPYQLHMIGKSKTGSVLESIIYKQYLIRFGNKDIFDFKTQHCISDKRNPFLWSKWYAITEEEYLSLTVTEAGMDTGYVYPVLNDECALNARLQPIKMEDIAFEKGIEKPKWNLDNCGITKAFDEDGNFVDD